MTEKQMLKYENKTVCVTKHVFPYSTKFEVITGVVKSIKSINIVPRRCEPPIKKEHTSFYVGDILIGWNELKLITKVEVIDDNNI